jgi:hypothetical protein
LKLKHNKVPLKLSIHKLVQTHQCTRLCRVQVLKTVTVYITRPVLFRAVCVCVVCRNIVLENLKYGTGSETSQKR